MHKAQSKIAAREIEFELGLRRVTSRKNKTGLSTTRAQGIRHFVGGWNLGIPSPQRPITFNLVADRSFVSCRKPPDVLQPLTLPTSGGSMLNMSKEQQIDFEAACDGKITWRQYFEKWGENGYASLSL